MTEVDKRLRTIRSFVRREGRITPGQRRALSELWPRYGLDPAGVLDLDAVFGRRARRMLEIGFGNGEALSAMAAAHPQHDYLGIEVHRPGVGRLLLALESQDLSNVRLVCADAKAILAQHVADASFDEVYLFFPDPWPKSRHHKRRLLQPAFADLVRSKLKPAGLLHLATDWADYARHMLEVLSAIEGWENLAGPSAYAARPGQRPLTKFERRGQALGHQVWDLIFRRKD